MTTPHKPSRQVESRNSGQRVWPFRVFLLFSLLTVAALAWAGLRASGPPSPSPGDATLRALATSVGGQQLPTPSLTHPPQSATAAPSATQPAWFGTLYYSARGAGRSHLWAYIPGSSTSLRLTSGDWDDLDPSVSPDGTRLAFASNRSGYWDLHILDLTTGDIRPLTQTAHYEGHPTWSPDGNWIAFEAYQDGDFDIWIAAAAGDQSPIKLTNHPAADVSPAWDPNGRRIAFVSDRAGVADVFLAELDRTENRFRNLTRTSQTLETAPSFSPDGTRLAYTSRPDGIDWITVLELQGSLAGGEQIGQGRDPVWAPDGQVLAGVWHTPGEAHAVAYVLDGHTLPPLGLADAHLQGGLSWSWAPLPPQAAVWSRGLASAPPLYDREEVRMAAAGSRLSLVDLPGVSAPRAALSDAVDEAFMALRARTAQEVGWDFLATLEEAFVGLNDPLPPGYAYNDWLYTGRAFAFSQATLRAGWVEVVREDYGGDTYWRVYVRASRQDGSLGAPLRQRPWDFDARFRGDPQAYDRGGQPRAQVPTGYYVDFTQLAADFGFERVPALPNWRTYLPGARYNEFALKDGLSWEAAMLELYPASALATPTTFQTPTTTPTRTPWPTATPWWWRWRTPTPSPEPSDTPTPFTLPGGGP